MGDSDKRRVRLALLAVLVLLLGIVGWWMLRGPTRPRRPAQPPGPPATAPGEAPAPALQQVRVVLLEVDATDTLPLVMDEAGSPTLADGVWVGDREGKALHILPRTIEAVETGQSDGTVLVAGGVKGFKSIEWALIEVIRYGGAGRGGTTRRVTFAANLPGAPQRRLDKEVKLGIEQPVSALYDVLPWPERLTWEVTPQGRLKVEADAAKQDLAAGQRGVLPKLTAKLPVRLTEFAPISVGVPVPQDANKTIERDLGTVQFTSEIAVTFVGGLPIEEATP